MGMASAVCRDSCTARKMAYARERRLTVSTTAATHSQLITCTDTAHPVCREERPRASRSNFAFDADRGNSCRTYELLAALVGIAEGIVGFLTERGVEHAQR